MLYNQIFYNVLKILAENGETRTVTLLKLSKTSINNMFVSEPLVFDHLVETGGAYFVISPISESSATYFLIDWGDSKINNEIRHLYMPGNYRVKIYGKKIRYINFDSGISNIQNFITIGRIGLVSLAFLFYKSEFNGIIGPDWDTTNIKSVKAMFGLNKKFNRKFGLNWDTTNITDMSYMFGYADLTNLLIDASKVIDMSQMFLCATNFDQ